MASTGYCHVLIISVLASLFVSVPAAPLFEGQQQQLDFTLSPPDWTTASSPPLFNSFLQSLTSEVPVFEQTTSQSSPNVIDVLNNFTTTLEAATNDASFQLTGRLNPAINREQELQQIKDTMVAGVTAIRDSLVHLITFVMGGASSVIQQQVSNVGAAVQHAVNHSAAIKDSLLAAGSGIAQTFGQSLVQTHNITHQLAASIFQGHQKPQVNPAQSS